MRPILSFVSLVVLFLMHLAFCTGGEAQKSTTQATYDSTYVEKIAFYSERNAPAEIYTMNVDGSGLKRLTTNNAEDQCPAFSPDGSQIAFCSNRDGNWEIYLMNNDGSNPKRLTSTSQKESQPEWSPDGSKILFQTHLLSAIITKTSNMSTLEFARKFLTDPMGITIDDWEKDPQGYYSGGNSMHFTQREMAVLGYLYLNDGKLEDKQILPSQWVALSLSPTTSRSSTPRVFFSNYAYGYLWWLGQINNHEVFKALGHGGQIILTFPLLNLIVVTTANNHVDWDTADAQESGMLEIVSRFV